jgi:hypothetical protein
MLPKPTSKRGLAVLIAEHPQHYQVLTLGWMVERTTLKAKPRTSETLEPPSSRYALARCTKESKEAALTRMLMVPQSLSSLQIQRDR